MTKPTLAVKSGFSRLRVDLTYDGSNFSGWAKQPNERTIQEEVEKALTLLTQSSVTTIVAGRTDAGVHAKHQVIHTDIPEQTDITNLVFRLNQILDVDIRVLDAQWAPANFHARFSAISRTYQYKIIDAGKITHPLNRYDSSEWFRPLDLRLMNEGSSLLLGAHDFFAYSKFREGGSTIKNLIKFNWYRDNTDLLLCEIQADSFRHNMVRNLVGAAVCVGEGRFAPEWMLETLKNRERISDSYVFPAKGLSLIEVEYPFPDQYLSYYEKYLQTQDNSSEEE